MRHAIVAAAVALAVAAASASGAAAATGVLSYATDATTVTSTIPATLPVCAPYPPYTFAVSQTYRPSAFGVSGPYRVDAISLSWLGPMDWQTTALAGSTPVASGGGGTVFGTDAAVTPVLTHDGAFPFIAPAATDLVLRLRLYNLGGWYGDLPPALGINTSGTLLGAPLPTYTDCNGATRTLNDVTLPWTVTIVPLSREDLASQTSLQLTEDPHMTAGQINALAQQALNGGLNDYLNTLTATTKINSGSLEDYLEQYARLLLGTSQVGYPTPDS